MMDGGTGCCCCCCCLFIVCGGGERKSVLCSICLVDLRGEKTPGDDACLPCMREEARMMIAYIGIADTIFFTRWMADFVTYRVTD